MVFAWIQLLSEFEDADDMADSYLTTTKYNGFQVSSVPQTDGTVHVGVQDGDTIVYLAYNSAIAEAAVVSVHTDDDSTSYQNTSGFDAVAVLTLATVSGSDEAHVKVYSSPNDNSTSSATLLWEYGNSASSSMFKAAGDLLTSPPLKIQNNHYIVIENVDESRAGDNTIDLYARANTSFVVERQV